VTNGRFWAKKGQKKQKMKKVTIDCIMMNCNERKKLNVRIGESKYQIDYLPTEEELLFEMDEIM
jgi:hypothetical protein